MDRRRRYSPPSFQEIAERLAYTPEDPPGHLRAFTPHEDEEEQDEELRDPRADPYIKDAPW